MSIQIKPMSASSPQATASELIQATVDVRFVLTGDAGEAEYGELLRKLPPDEQVEASRYHQTRDRLAFAIGRVLARATLSLHVPEPAGGWRFERSRYGKPALVRGTDTSDLRFNIAHCIGAIVVAVSHGQEIGVDIEPLDEVKIDHLELAREHFAASEIALLETLPAAQQRKTFLALWTLKEAYLKARGVGLSEPLSEFSFKLNPPSIAFSNADANRPEHWFFAQQELASSHLLAIAVERHSAHNILYRLTQMNLAELVHSQ